MIHRRLIPDPHHDETPASFCSRVAVMCGRSAPKLCSDLGMSYRGILSGDPPALAALAKICRAETVEGWITSVVARNGRLVIGGEVFARSMVSPHGRRACVHCLAADLQKGVGPLRSRPYGRAAWRVSALRTCPRHLCPISTFATCLPGSDEAFDVGLLDEGTPIGSQTLSAFEEHLLDRLAGRRVVGWLADFPAYAAVRISEVLGTCAELGVHGKTEGLSDADWHRVRGVGFDIANAGPDAIRPLLDTFARAFFAERTDWGNGKLLGRLAGLLNSNHDNPDYGPLRETVAEYLADTLPIAAGTTMFGVRIERRRLHSVHSLARQSGRHPATVRRILLASGLIEAGSAALSDGRVLVGAEDAERSLEETTLTHREMAEYINASRPHPALLVDAGFIKPVDRPYGSQRLRPAYRVVELDRFLADLTRDVGSDAETDPQMLDLPTAARQCNCSAMEIVRLLLDRRLPTVRALEGSRGYVSVLVSPEEVAPLVRGSDDGGLKLREVTTILRSTDRVVTALVLQGRLPARIAVNPVNRCRQKVVEPADLVEFMRRYVSASELARATGRKIADLTAFLRENGVHPVFDRAEVGVAFYERAASLAALRRPV